LIFTAWLPTNGPLVFDLDEIPAPSKERHPSARPL
jgi:hypothetical protein